MGEPLSAGWSKMIEARGRDLMGFLTRHHGARGTLARTWPTGSMALWVAILLAVFVVAYYL